MSGGYIMTRNLKKKQYFEQKSRRAERLRIVPSPGLHEEAGAFCCTRPDKPNMTRKRPPLGLLLLL
jgi:hypothetical protein